MADDGRILDLMVRWDEACAAGEAPTVDALCPNDPDLQHALRQRIERRQRLLAALEVPGATLSANGPAAQDRMTLIDGFELLEVLGRGGMGVVYKAKQRDLNRVVAVKTLLAGAAAGPVESTRIRREAEAVSNLRHPNIIQIHQIGEHDGCAYLVLEYAAGGSLASQIEGTPMPPERAARIMLSLAQAIQHAHDAGIVHRDLKPANVLLDAAGTPKVADFGLAKRLDFDLGLTQTGSVLGSPSYMAPEQAEGRTRDVGPATDIYALGAILYQMLTGRPPFQGATLLETLEQVRSHECPSPRTLRPSVPRDLETICLQCLRKRPGDRYPTAASLADDLRRFLAGEAVTARSLSLVEQVGRSLGVMSVDGGVGRAWGGAMLAVAPVAFLGHLFVFLFARGLPNYAWISLSMSGATIFMLLTSFWLVIWPRTKMIDRTQRRFIGSVMTGYMFTVILLPWMVVRGLPLIHPNEAFLIYPVWLVFAGTMFIVAGSHIGALYVTAGVAYAAALITSFFPLISPLVVGLAISLDLAGQGMYIRRAIGARNAANGVQKS